MDDNTRAVTLASLGLDGRTPVGGGGSGAGAKSAAASTAAHLRQPAWLLPAAAALAVSLQASVSAEDATRAGLEAESKKRTQVSPWGRGDGVATRLLPP